jgi:hypothetical protein
VPQSSIPASVRDLYPTRAHDHRIIAVWKPVRDEQDPTADGVEGWSTVDGPATALAIQDLRDRGFSWVNLEASGVPNPFRNARIADLL